MLDVFESCKIPASLGYMTVYGCDRKCTRGYLCLMLLLLLLLRVFHVN